MRKVGLIKGTMAPLPRANVDTDQIMPKQFLKRVERTGYGEFVFYDWRFDSEGKPRDDFVLNRPEYRKAKVLVTGANFGCGSSREHAPWGLQDWGLEAVIAPSFADIFYNNCTKIGLLPVTLSEAEVDHLLRLAEDPNQEVMVDLDRQLVRAKGLEAGFEIDPFVKRCLLEGLDDIDLTLEHEELISAHERRRADFLPHL